jgi:hypothetical protein
MWDPDLQAYWGLVRIDAGFVGKPGIANSNPRRTGRFTTPDMLSGFTPAMEVFNGTSDYQIYMVLPFKLPSYRPGYYLATASFLLLNQTVRTELLQTGNYGKNWSQVSPGTQYLPLGEPGAFDSYTTYTSWSGTSAPLLDPKSPNRTIIYYAGGDGPHDGTVLVRVFCCLLTKCMLLEDAVGCLFDFHPRIVQFSPFFAKHGCRNDSRPT